MCGRCNVADMLDGLPCIIAVLLENGHALASLPVIALLEWLAQHIQGLLPAIVAVRLQRAQALTQLGLLAEAASVLAALMQVACFTAAHMQTTQHHCCMLSCFVSAHRWLPEPQMISAIMNLSMASLIGCA